MSDILISFGCTQSTRVGSRHDHPIPLIHGSTLRTEVMQIGAIQHVTESQATGSENVVILHPDEDCWVCISKSPSVIIPTVGQIGTGVKLKACRDYQFSVEIGDKVAVVQA